MMNGIINKIRGIFSPGPKTLPKVSVVIPTLNGSNDLATLLPLIKKQSGIRIIEIIIVDSGSSDGTLKVAKNNGAKIIRIPNKKFSHHYARNLGAKHAKGKLLLFMTQDAVPPNEKWLLTMYKAMIRYNAAAVSCREEPKKDADLFARICIWNHNRFLDIDKDNRILKMPKIQDYEGLRYRAQLNNVACLIKRNLFNKFRFKTEFAEDLDLGLRLIRSGYKCGLLGKVWILHSHTRDMYYYLKRHYLDTMVMAQFFNDFLPYQVYYKDIMNEIPLALKITLKTAERLDTVPAPCRTKEITERTVAYMVNKRSHPFRLKAGKKVSGLVDKKFMGFIKRTYREYPSKYFRISRNGIVASMIATTKQTVAQYLDSHYRLLDKPLKREYKMNLLKFFAAKCGSMLAACYINGSPADKKKMKKIHKELFDHNVAWKGTGK